MFDVGFSELIVIGVVALIVIGPDKLPKVAKLLGSIVGRMQRYVASVKAEVEREMNLQELKELQEKNIAEFNNQLSDTDFKSNPPKNIHH
jgi:sec-independent protein translocase protein TatB